MSSFAKAWLGPARTRACNACGKRVSVAWRSMFIQLLFLSVLNLWVWRWPWWTAIAPAVVGGGLVFIHHLRKTPLVARRA
jgi:hypothetical protein